MWMTAFKTLSVTEASAQFTVSKHKSSICSNLVLTFNKLQFLQTPLDDAQKNNVKVKCPLQIHVCQFSLTRAVGRLVISPQGNYK